MRGFLRNIAANYSAAGINGLLFLLVTPVVVQSLGIAQYSTWVIVQTLGYYLGFLDLGLVDAQIRRHAGLKAARRFDELRSLLRTVMSLYLLAGAAGVAIALGLAASPIDGWLDIPPAVRSYFPLLLVVIGAHNVCALLNRGLDAVYEAEERFDALNAIQVAIAVCRAGAVCIVMFSGHGLVALLSIHLVFGAAGVLAKLTFIPIAMRHLDRPRPGFSGESWRSIRNYSLWNSLNDFMTEGTAHFDKLLIPLLLGSALVGPYALTVTVAAAVFLVAEPITSTFLPMFSRVRQSGSGQSTRILLLRGTRLVLLFTLPVALVIAVLGDALLDLWIGEEYTPVPPAVLWFTIGNFFFSTLLWTPLNLLMAAGHIRTIFQVSVAEVALAVVLILLLAPPYGLPGLALAGLVANVAIGFAFFIPMACREAQEPVRRFLGTTLLPALAVAVPTGALGWVLARSIDTDSWLDVLAGAALCGAASFLALGMLAMPRRERFRYLVTARQMLGPAG